MLEDRTNGFKLRDIEIWSKAMSRAGLKTTAWPAVGVESARGDEEGSVRLNASASCLDGTQVTIALVFDAFDRFTQALVGGAPITCRGLTSIRR